MASCSSSTFAPAVLLWSFPRQPGPPSLEIGFGCLDPAPGPLSSPAQPWNPTGAPCPKPHLPKGEPHLPPHQTTTTTPKHAQHTPKALANAAPIHPKPTVGVQQPDTSQSLTECQHPPKNLQQNHQQSTSTLTRNGITWWHPEVPAHQPAPLGEPMSPQSHHEPDPWKLPTALGIVPEPVTFASPVPPNRMSFRTQDLLLLVVLAFLCACVKGLQVSHSQAASAKWECRIPSTTKSN